MQNYLLQISNINQKELKVNYYSTVRTEQVEMSSSQLYVSLPVYQGFMKIIIWHEPDSVSKINPKAKKILKRQKTNNFHISRLSVAMVYSLLMWFWTHSKLKMTWSSPSILDTDMLQFLEVASMMPFKLKFIQQGQPLLFTMTIAFILWI